MTKKIGQKIKEIRLQKGIKQKDLAIKLGYKYSSTLSEIESGKKGIDIQKVLIASKELGVSIHELLNESILETGIDADHVS